MSSDLARALSIVRPNNLPRISILTAALHGAELYALRKRLARAQDRATEMLATLQVSQMPTREDLLAAAKAMFARTPSLDEMDLPLCVPKTQIRTYWWCSPPTSA